MSFWIVTDACCDLPTDYIRSKENLLVVPMNYQMDGQEYVLDLTRDDNASATHEFYEKLLTGSVSTTSQINQQTWMDQLEPLLAQGNDVLVLAFSSGLSGTYQASRLAVEDLRAKYPERKIFTVDSLSASMGEGLFVHRVLEYRDQGNDIDAAYQWAKDHTQSTIHWFTVNDLHFLRRGGRVSATSAYLGSMLKIKPVLNVDPNGKLIPREKVQGRKHSLRELFEMVEKYADSPETQTMFISHGDCIDDAEWLAKKLRKELKVPRIVMSFIGPIIGTHSGPGTVAVFFVDSSCEGRMNAVE